MSWKEELVTTQNEAMDFLRRSLTEAGFSNFDLMDLSEGEFDRFTPCAMQENTDSAEDESLVHFATVDRMTDCMIDGFSVHSEFRGRGLGLIALKAMLGSVYSFAHDTILLNHVDETGPSFWPSLGAVPKEPPVTLAADIRNFLNREKKNISSEDKSSLKNIAKTADKNPYQGWRMLGLSEIDRSIRHRLFEKICLYKDLLLFPGEPVTRKILQDKLGLLPPFMVPATVQYKLIARSLTPSRPRPFGPKP